MEIESIAHKALRKFAETGKAKGVPEAARLIRILSFIDASVTFDDLETVPNFGLHPLKGDRKGQFAMTVTKNWRLTFTKVSETAIADLDLEDYH